MKPLRIAIDGPSGSGKSTLGMELARRLGLAYVDTGALYRAVAWKALREGASGPAAVAELVRNTELEIEADPEGFVVRVDGIDVTAELRRPEVGLESSRLAAIPEVRACLLPLQRRLGRESVVMEGRDIGTVVLPDADCKFFVTSEEATRMARRAAQLGPDGRNSAAEDVSARDHRDTSRKISPLRPASDAIEIDTSRETVEESVARMLDLIEQRCGHRT